MALTAAQRERFPTPHCLQSARVERGKQVVIHLRPWILGDPGQG